MMCHHYKLCLFLKHTSFFPPVFNCRLLVHGVGELKLEIVEDMMVKRTIATATSTVVGSGCDDDVGATTL